MKRVAIALVCALISACGGSKSPTTPSAPTTPTKIIVLAGDLAFGNVDVGSSAIRTFTIGNTGNTVLTFTGMSCAAGTSTAAFSASPLSGTVSPGTTVPVSARFAPTAAQGYGCVLTVAADHTAGENRINMSGSGVNNTPLFTRGGTGANVFDMPTTVTRVRIQADYGGSCENFIVHIGGRGVVNDILGTCSVASGRHFDGTFTTTGGVVEVLNSSGISWSFTEVR
jgi:hypothetical protein